MATTQRSFLPLPTLRGSFPVPHHLLFCVVGSPIWKCSFLYLLGSPAPEQLLSCCVQVAGMPDGLPPVRSRVLAAGPSEALDLPLFSLSGTQDWPINHAAGQAAQHSGITNRWAPAKTSHTMATKETYLSLTLLILFLLLPFLISCDLSCQLEHFLPYLSSGVSVGLAYASKGLHEAHQGPLLLSSMAS